MLRRQLFTTVAFSFFSCVSLSETNYFISVDGMRPDYLSKLSENGYLTTPNGLGDNYLKGAKSLKAFPGFVTLTAPSHISTITCSKPNTHGIVANNYLQNGKMLNGFSETIKAETMWQSAMRSGKKVLALAYVGADGNTPERSADYGIAYPDGALVSPTQTLTLKFSELPAAVDWTLNDGSTIDLTKSKETTIKVVLNPVTKEERVLNALVTETTAQNYLITVATSKNLNDASSIQLSKTIDLKEMNDLYFVEENNTSATFKFKRRVAFSVLERSGDQVKLFVSRPTYNKAYPEKFRQALDDQNLVWADDGWRGDKQERGLNQMLFVYERHGDLLVKAGLLAKSMEHFDIVLFYQPVIDSVGHSYQALMPADLLADPNHPIGKGMIEAFKLVDRNIARIHNDAEQNDVVAIMGDHGMEPIFKLVNLGVFLKDKTDKVNVVSSGALTLVYRAPGVSLDEVTAIADELEQKINTVQFNGNAVTGRTFRKFVNGTETHDWMFGEADFAFTSAGKVYYTYDPLKQDVLLEPSALGMHGHDASVETMATGFVIRGPHIAPSYLPEMNLVDAVPTFAEQVGIEKPANCTGHPLALKSPKK